MTPDFLDKLANQSATNVQVQDQRERANQQPAITDAKDTGVAAQATADDAFATLIPIGVSMEWNAAGDPPGGRWMVEDGRLLNQADYPALYAVVGGAFNTGGEGAGQFRIPDSRGRVAVGAGAGSGLTSRALAARGGEENHTLLETEFASHNHGGTNPISSAGSHGHTINTDYFEMSGTFGSGRAVYSPNTWPQSANEFADTQGSHTHSFNLPFNGGDQGHNNMQPWIGKPKIIRVL